MFFQDVIQQITGGRRRRRRETDEEVVGSWRKTRSGSQDEEAKDKDLIVEVTRSIRRAGLKYREG